MPTSGLSPSVQSSQRISHLLSQQRRAIKPRRVRLDLLRSVQSCSHALTQHSTEAATLDGVGEMCTQDQWGAWEASLEGGGDFYIACLPFQECQHVFDHMDCHFRKLAPLTDEPHIPFCLGTRLGSGSLCLDFTCTTVKGVFRVALLNCNPVFEVCS